MDPALLVAQVLSYGMQVPPERVIVVGERWDPPEDQELYVLVGYERDQIIGMSREYDPATGYETVDQSLLTHLRVEVVSRGLDAEARHPEVALVLGSVYAIRAAEDAGCRIYRPGEALNISAVEGSAPLRRYRMAVAVAHLRSRSSPIPQIVLFPPLEVKHGQA